MGAEACWFGGLEEGEGSLRPEKDVDLLEDDPLPFPFPLPFLFRQVILAAVRRLSPALLHFPNVHLVYMNACLWTPCILDSVQF